MFDLLGARCQVPLLLADRINSHPHYACARQAIAEGDVSMIGRQWVAGMVSVCVLGVGIGTVLAQPPAKGPDAIYTPPRGINEGQPQPLMGLLEQAGVGRPLEDA